MNIDVDSFMANEDPKFAHIVARIPSGWGRWLDVGPGWHALVVRLDADLAAVDPNYKLLQCKEKWGGLRYYIGHIHNDACGSSEGSDWNACKLHRLVNEAEGISLTICEQCGNRLTAYPRSGSWIRTLCDEHGEGRPGVAYEWPAE